MGGVPSRAMVGLTKGATMHRENDSAERAVMKDSGRTRPALAVQLGLEEHPEGGWYRRLRAAGEQVDTSRG